MGFAVTDVPELLVRVLDDRRALVRVHRRDLLDHACDLHRIVDHDLPRLRRAKVGELIQHLLRRTQEKRRLVVCIIESFPGHDDPAVYFVIRIQEMHVAGCHNGLAELLAQLHNLPVDVFQVLLGRHIRRPVAGDHESVVPQGLDLIVIIEFRQLRDLLGGPFLQDRLVEFPGLTGAADEQAFPVFIQQALRDPWPSRVVGQMGLRDQLIEIVPSDIIFRQDNDMVGRHLADGVYIAVAVPVDLFQRENAVLFQHLHEFHKDFRRSPRIIHRPVVIFQ